MTSFRIFLAAIFLSFSASVFAATVELRLPAQSSPRVQFGAERLAQALQSAGLTVYRANSMAAAVSPDSGGVAHRIQILTTEDSSLGSEGFSLKTEAQGEISVRGGDDSGALYACLELAKRVAEAHGVPASLDVTERPAMKLRGACIGMQKTYILPGRHVYEYPYTPDLFPFFYDKAFWEKYLDFLAANRMNTLYLWNGHPFASLVKVADYPYAQEVSDDVFQRNVEMYRYLTEEADKRGIWVVQMFYNILLSKPFAERNGLATQLSATNPIAADYTRKSIAEFVRQYPNVGLMVCLGEALQDVPQQSTWCTDVILAGVKDGMAAAGLKEEPPVIIRAHATDESVIMPAALKVYRNLYTEAKYNGESLTTWEPRGMWQKRHLAMSKLGMHVANVHILANLEPFRYGAQRFIHKSVLAMRDRLGASGLHLYPLAYWNWPYSPDAVQPRLEQIERDWIWFEAWARYAWAPDIDEKTDHAYWVARLAERYGSTEAAEKILAAYNDSGECAPRLLRRFGITEGNRQTLSLGMTLDELVDPARYRAYEELWLSQAPPGERLQEYAEKERTHQPHVGETPVTIIDETLEFSSRAVAEIDAAEKFVTANREEYERLRNDVRCIRAMTLNYAEKARAAMAVLRHRWSQDPADLAQAEKHLAASLEHFRELTRLTEKTYQFANTMQTSQRRIPVPGGLDGKPANYHWTQLLPIYEKELAEFRSAMASKPNEKSASALRTLAFTTPDSTLVSFPVEKGQSVFADEKAVITEVAPGMQGLRGIRLVTTQLKEPIALELQRPALVLVGYAHAPHNGWARVPQLETDALAGEQGSVEVWKENVVSVDGVGPIDVYAFRLAAGHQSLRVRGEGKYVILGVIERETSRSSAPRP